MRAHERRSQIRQDLEAGLPHLLRSVPPPGGGGGFGGGGMCLTRSVDNRLKQFFMGGEVRWGDMAFQGKGFRSLGQEAIYAGAIRLTRRRSTATPTVVERRRDGAGDSRSRHGAGDAPRRGSRAR